MDLPSPALPFAIEPGQRIDRYELLFPIAHGGMGAVWVARLQGKHGFEKFFAIKMILPQYAQERRFRTMFLDEARIASGIEHPNVAQILDLGEQGGLLYLIMEWVEGDSLYRLNKILKKAGQRMPLGIALRVLADASAGAHAVHELADKSGHPLDVVHRDISPQNILVSSKGMAKLIDFGVAKARDRLSGETSSGTLKGKLRYMAPEQAVGGEIDRRADVWGLGAVLYSILAGRAPYVGPNEAATLHVLMQGEPPPPLPESLPKPIVDLVGRTLVHDVKKRLATAGELARALERAMVECGVTTTTEDVAAFAKIHLRDTIAARRQSLIDAERIVSDRAKMHAYLAEKIGRDDATGSGVSAARREIARASRGQIALSPSSDEEVDSDASVESGAGNPPTLATATVDSHASVRAPTKKSRAGLVAFTFILAVVAIGVATARGVRSQGPHVVASPPPSAPSVPSATPAISVAAIASASVSVEPAPSTKPIADAPAVPADAGVKHRSKTRTPDRVVVASPPSTSATPPKPHDDGSDFDDALDTRK